MPRAKKYVCYHLSLLTSWTFYRKDKKEILKSPEIVFILYKYFDINDQLPINLFVP